MVGYLWPRYFLNFWLVAYFCGGMLATAAIVVFHYGTFFVLWDMSTFGYGSGRMFLASDIVLLFATLKSGPYSRPK